MARGMKTGGRKPGTPNRRTSELAAMLAQAVGEDFDPVVDMALLAKHPDTSIELRARLLADIAPYVRPRLKNSEISGPNGGALQFEVVSAIGGPAESVQALETGSAVIDQPMAIESVAPVSALPEGAWSEDVISPRSMYPDAGLSMSVMVSDNYTARPDQGAARTDYDPFQ